MTDADAKPRTRRILLQVLGFILGVALLGWCIKTAVSGGDWSRIRHADPLLVLGLVGATFVSQAASIGIFFITIRPVRPLTFRDLTGVNLVASMLNYAPVRLGLAARVAWHIKVDRVPVLMIGAWFAAMTLTLMGAVAAATIATLVRPTFDWLWTILLVGCVVIAGVSLRGLAASSFVKRFGRGADRMLGEPIPLWGSMLLRLVDLGAYAARMWFAIRILGLTFSGDDVLLLAIADLVIGMNPLGRFGFREAAIAFVASRLANGSSASVESTFAQLALVNSASEAIVVIPLGLFAALWLWRRWRSSAADPNQSVDH